MDKVVVADQIDRTFTPNMNRFLQPLPPSNADRPPSHSASTVIDFRWLNSQTSTYNAPRYGGPFVNE